MIGSILRTRAPSVEDGGVTAPNDPGPPTPAGPAAPYPPPSYTPPPTYPPPPYLPPNVPPPPGSAYPGSPGTGLLASSGQPGGTGIPPAGPGRGRDRGRPRFILIILASVAWGLSREGLQLLSQDRLGVLGPLLVAGAGLALILGWRWDQRRRAAKRGGEYTPEIVAKQLQDSGLLPPAYPEDGTIPGASILVLNQRPKILEVETQYEVFGSHAQPLGHLTQIAQSGGKQVARVLTAFDQYFTHHFELIANDGTVLLRMTRPRKIFTSRVEIFDGANRYLGKVHQKNVFWKIRFGIHDAVGNQVALLAAANLRAWDFQVHDHAGAHLATVVKSWEGWGRTAFTRADRYVLRIHQPVPAGLRALLVAVPLTIDVALKQDARGLG